MKVGFCFNQKYSEAVFLIKTKSVYTNIKIKLN